MASTKLTINNNGSVKIEGDFEIVDKSGNPYGLGGREVISMCRCGLSKNKPFCDGSHKGPLRTRGHRLRSAAEESIVVCSLQRARLFIAWRVAFNKSGYLTDRAEADLVKRTTALSTGLSECR